MIEIKQLTKKYNETTAINGLSFEISSGSIVGLLGPNGAGKTTTMRILSGYMPPTSGSALIGSIDAVINPFEVKKITGYLPEDNPLYIEMTPLEYLEFCADIRGMAKGRIKERIKEVVEICGINDVLIKPISALSRGYRQRVGIAQAVLHDPPVLILDEPTSGLDPNQIVEIRELIGNLKGKKSIIISTHIMQEVQAICDRVIIINKGGIVADGTHDELTSSSGKTVYSIELDGPENEILEKLSGLKSIGRVDKKGLEFNIECINGQDPRRDIFEIARQNNWPILMLKKSQESLEAVFRVLTTEEK